MATKHAVPRLAAALLALACSGDAIAPDPTPADPEPDPPAANRPPTPTGEIPAQRLAGPGDTLSVDLAAHFDDPDGDSLTFAAASSDTAAVRVAVAGAVLSLAGGSAGGAGTVTATASDPSGLEAAASFVVAVNRAPVASEEIPPQNVIDGMWVQLDVSGYFDDLDGDTLALQAASSDTTIVRVTLAANVLHLEAWAVGEAAVTVTASDPDGLDAQTVFAVEVVEHPDRAALAALYSATDGLNWRRNDNWLTDAPLGEWYGVRVSSDGRVVWLVLSGTQDGMVSDGLAGSIPPELGNLTRLELLSLGGNALTGPIPPELGSLSNLESLLLQDNDLAGPIPPELGNLSRLESLLLYDNDLAGPIPPELGGLASLEDLLLGNNSLYGPIPPELANLASLERLGLVGNEGLCAPDDTRLRAWLASVGATVFACRLSPVRLLPSALIREDSNGLSLALPGDLHVPAAMHVSEPGVVAASVADGWLELAPRHPGTADVELVPAGGGHPAVVGVVVREAVGTFGIDIVMEQPAPIGYAGAMTAAADWWSSALDGTEWPDRPVREGCFDDIVATADELVIFASNVARSDSHAAAWAYTCTEQVHTPDVSHWVTGYLDARGGGVVLGRGSAHSVDLMRHEIGHVLGLVPHPGGLGTGFGRTTEDGYFIGPRAVEAYRAGGGDPDLPGPRVRGSHWDFGEIGCELMVTSVCQIDKTAPAMDGLSLAALGDMGYTVDMSKATPWRKLDRGAYSLDGRERFQDVVTVRTGSRVPRR